jgi:hypothetical protein
MKRIGMVLFVLIVGCATTEQKISGFSNGFFAGYGAELIDMQRQAEGVDWAGPERMHLRIEDTYTDYRKGIAFAPNTKAHSGRKIDFEAGYNGGAACAFLEFDKAFTILKNGGEPTPLTKKELEDLMQRFLQKYLSDN